MQERFETTIGLIRSVNRHMAPIGQAHIDNLTKPRGSLGRLEDLALQLYLIQEDPPEADPMRIYTVAGDHGVCDENVSLFPQEVTRQMVLNFLTGGAGINVMAATAGVQLRVVDAGVRGGTFAEHPQLIQAKVAPGTANLAEGPAMSLEQCLQALLLGLSLADKAAREGVKVLGTGDMGIGNTTPSTALYCAYLGLDPVEVAGPGTGLNKQEVASKAEVVARGLASNHDALESGDPITTLAALGGFEIATLAGLILGGARNHQLVCVDGFISTAAYTAAWKICPSVRDYCVISHVSAEPGHKKALNKLGLAPLFDLGFRLGEGTGAACAMYLVRSATNMYNRMATYAGAGVSEGR